MACTIDVQGYTTSEHGLLPKEICIYAQNSVVKFHVNPCKQLWQFSKEDRCRIGWATNKYHFIDWNEGDTDLSDIPYFVYHAALPYDKIYTKGREKALYLMGLLGRPVEDLTLYNCPSLRPHRLPACSIHKSSEAHCAFANAKYMYQWITERLEEH
jgi:hypothetical protein